MRNSAERYKRRKGRHKGREKKLGTSIDGILMHTGGEGEERGARCIMGSPLAV